ncbi:hypothetical protein [Luteimonas deserti]|uniref:Relaxation protein n=1 Tax=Luteimonas deserti TaxID=2752306 RepID=A0A7Z0QQJ5_9GAMM|nr:hypothetical protein [Luteimonas deserti]NYZ62863.1 hypothetical protein [Luteimonas deserti]
MPPAPTDITEDALHDLLAKMAVLVAQFDRHCAQSREALQTSAREIPQQVRASADQQMERLHTALSAQVGSAIERPVARCMQQLDASSAQLQRASDALAAQAQRSDRVHRGALWKSTGVAGVALLAILIAGASSARYYAGEVQRQRISAELLRAYNAADVQLCGERLCVRPEADADVQGGYVRAALR